MIECDRVETKELTAEQLLQKLNSYFMDSNISRKLAKDKHLLLMVAELLLPLESHDMRINYRGDKFTLTHYVTD